MIKSEDITVVVQGSIDKKNTPICLKSVRKYLPKSKIILSTWENSITNKLDFDLLILSKDPGAFTCDFKYNIKNNVNRQILSSAVGLRKCETKYALKIRSDIKLKNTNFLKYFEKYQGYRNEECKIFEKRIVINNLYAANPKKTPFLFHISDWTQFGLTKDINNLWDIPIQEEPTSSQYFVNKPRPPIDPVPSWQFRYIPEQYIWVSVLIKNNINLNFKYHTDLSEDNLRASELSFANNLIIADYENFGIKFLKFNPYKWDYKKQLNHRLWILLFKKYCNPQLQLSWKQKIETAFDTESSQKKFKKLKKQYKILFKPVEYLFRWIFSPLLILYYFFKTLASIINELINQD